LLLFLGLCDLRKNILARFNQMVVLENAQKTYFFGQESWILQFLKIPEVAHV
jgi:hypothetical protein